MKLLDLFSGIGGFSLAASWAGIIGWECRGESIRGIHGICRKELRI